MLAHKQCNMNVQKKLGDTPLRIAVWYINEQKDTIVQLLSYEECNPNVQNKEGDTPLHIAVRDNVRASAVSQFLSNKQNLKNTKCDTARGKQDDTTVHAISVV